MTWTFATYNMFDMFLQTSGTELARYDLVAEVIRDMDADVVAVQELRGPSGQTQPATAGVRHSLAEASAGLARLAQMTGMTATVAAGRPDDGNGGGEGSYAVGVGSHGFHVGLLWRPTDRIEPIPGSLRVFGEPDFWHGLVRLGLRIDGRPVTVASYHATPFGRQARVDQAEAVVARMTRPAGPGLIGADWNTVMAARVDAVDGRRVCYDPDPYADRPWTPDMVYQCEWMYDSSGSRLHWADRRSAEVLVCGGLHDAAAALGVPWTATTGHHPADTFGQHGINRRIDAVYATTDACPDLIDYEVVDTDAARRASDHLPVKVTMRS